MTDIMKFKKDVLEKDGFLIVDLNVPRQVLRDAQSAYKQLYKRVELGEYNYIRVYDDYIGRINIAGIEMPFHPNIIDRRLVELLNYSNVAGIAKKVLGSRIKMTLSRYHITGKYSHIGNWHRDDEAGGRNTLQISVFLFDEKGFELIPGSHDRAYSKFEKRVLKQSDRANLPRSLHLSAKAGTMVVFNPAIIHRGISENFRANIHFRFERDDDYRDDYYQNIVGFNADWIDILKNKNSIIVASNIKTYNHPKKVIDFLRRCAKTFIHYGIFWLPIESELYKKTGAYPSLKLRSIFGFFGS